MKPSVKKLLFWTPRIICILFAAFLTIFSADVFDEAKGFREIAIGLFMHNLPVFGLIIVLIISWKWEWVGGAFYILLGLAYIISFWGRFVLSTYFFIAGPLFLLGILFIIGWIYRKEIRGKVASSESLH
jgi:hypothetical protein